jgi:CheY-like chemotaxis protein
MGTVILIVDDEQVRHDIAESIFTKEGHTLLHAFNYEEGKQILETSTQPIGLLLLDHDLGMGKTGSDLAGFILNELDLSRFPAQAVCHSWSSEGAKNCAAKMRTAQIPTRIWPFDADMCRFMVVQLEPQ